MANKGRTDGTDYTDRGHHRWRIKVTQKSQIAQKFGHHRWLGYVGRCAQNCKKIVQKIIQNIRPSQMAIYGVA